MKKFEVGRIYLGRSICDSNCIFKIEVLSRTAKTIKVIFDDTEIKTLRIFEFDDCENVKPLGSYSMAPTIRAKNEKLAENYILN